MLIISGSCSSITGRVSGAQGRLAQQQLHASTIVRWCHTSIASGSRISKSKQKLLSWIKSRDLFSFTQRLCNTPVRFKPTTDRSCSMYSTISMYTQKLSYPKQKYIRVLQLYSWCVVLGEPTRSCQTHMLLAAASSPISMLVAIKTTSGAVSPQSCYQGMFQGRWCLVLGQPTRSLQAHTHLPPASQPNTSQYASHSCSGDSSPRRPCQRLFRVHWCLVLGQPTRSLQAHTHLPPASQSNTLQYASHSYSGDSSPRRRCQGMFRVHWCLVLGEPTRRSHALTHLLPLIIQTYV
jgi:hypothetical protein